EHVDDEHERVGALDARVGLACGAVPGGGRYDEDDAAARLHTDQGLVPAGDDLPDPDGEGGGEPTVEGAVEGRGVLAPDLALVVGDQQVAALHDGTGALDDRLHHEVGRRGVGRDDDGRLRPERPGDGRRGAGTDGEARGRGRRGRARRRGRGGARRAGRGRCG